ncbi:hypothetical protein D3C84_1144200 [compost metagenome]
MGKQRRIGNRAANFGLVEGPADNNAGFIVNQIDRPVDAYIDTVVKLKKMTEIDRC